MRVLIFTQHFTPEITAARSRMHPIAEVLAERGHEVEVITAVPNHPEGVIQDGYRNKAVVRRSFDGFDVSYVWVRTSPRKSFASRLALYGTYAAMAAAVGSVARRPDVIFATSPPLPAAAAAAVVAARFRVPWVMDVRDLWPEAAVVLGELSDPRAIRAAEALERRLYSSAAAVVTVTEAFRSDIARRTEDVTKISVIPNGTTSLWLDAATAEVDRSALGIPADRFVWTYAGNVGIAQGLESAVDAAAELGEGFQLRVIGQGPRLEAVRERAAGLADGRVVFESLMPPAEAARHLRASDASLVPLAARPEMAKFVPSKLFDCCAVGRPVVLAAEGQSRELAVAAEAAYPVPPGDAAALADAMRTLQSDPELCRRLSERGVAFASDYRREVQIERLEGILQAALASP